jgi:hypothetical protein
MLEVGGSGLLGVYVHAGTDPFWGQLAMVVEGDYLQKPLSRREEHYCVQTGFQLLERLDLEIVRSLGLLAQPGQHLAESS